MNKMRGFNLFITDLRNCKGREEEAKRINKELANIRTKFKGNRLLNGYQKKKYICKLVYIYLLGYEFEFGQMEAINILSSNAYSEKLAGYLFISVVVGESHDHMSSIINALKNDLSSPNYIFQNMALQFIANSCSTKLADCFSNAVINLLLHSTAPDSLRQSAVLALLQFLRLKSDFVLCESTVTRLIDLVSHHHLGLVTASSSLVEFLVKKYPNKCTCCVTQCIDRLSRIVCCSSTDFLDYSFHTVKMPWITVKLLRILRNFPLILDTVQRTRLKYVLQSILEKKEDNTAFARKSEQNSTHFAVLLEAISLIFHMDFQDRLLCQAFWVLGCTLKETNVNIKCTALEILIQLASNTTYSMHVKSQWITVFKLLNSVSDITIKNQVIHLLYNICSDCSVKPIVAVLLNLLEYNMEDAEINPMKIASLAEKFGTDRQWYLDTIFKLYLRYEDNMNDSVWYSLVKTVIDEDSIQEYAAEVSYNVLYLKDCPDTLIKMTGYILGEFGYLIARNSQSDYQMQFNVLKEKYRSCSSSTKALLLTTFIKILNIYPGLESDVHSIFMGELKKGNEDEEIRQRAVEYLKLGQIASRSLLATVLEEMPSKIQNTTGTVDIINVNGSQMLCVNQIEKDSRKENLGIYDACNHIVENPNDDNISMCTSESQPITKCASSFSNQCLFADAVEKTNIDNSVVDTLLKQSSHILPNNNFFLHSMLFNEKGKLFENYLIAISIESYFNKHQGIIELQYTNKTNNEFSEFSVQGNFSHIENKCRIVLKPISSSLPPKRDVKQEIRLECLKQFAERPSLNLKFIFTKQKNEVELKLPLTLNKFIEPCDMTFEMFLERWENFEPLKQEVRKKFNAKFSMIYGATRIKLEGFRFSVIENIVPESENFACAGTFHTRNEPIDLLIRLERYPF